MHIATNFLLPDEPCHGLALRHLNGRFVEQVFVVRGDTIAKHETDLGASEDWSDIPPLLMPCFGDESVASMQDWGERHRFNPKWALRLAERKAGSTLIKDVIEQYARNEAIIRNRSVLGPAVRVQRNGYDRHETWRQIKEKRTV